MYKLGKWKLDDVMKVKDADRLIREIEKLVVKIEGKRELLKPGVSSQKFMGIMSDMERIAALFTRVGYYPHLWSAADTKSQEAKRLEMKVDDKLTPLQNRLIFFSLWWKELNEKEAQRLLKASGKYRYHLEMLRKFKPYTLSEAEEKVINIKDSTGADALVELYTMLKTGFKFKFKGKEMNEEELSQFVHSKSAKTRKDVYDVMLGRYKEYLHEFGYVYQNVVRDYKNENMVLRGFKKPIAVKNLRNDIPDAVVDVLLKVVQKNVSVFQRYFRLKAKLIGIKKLRRYDIYAPIRGTVKKYKYDDAVRLVLGLYKDFSPEMHAHITRVFDEEHIDSSLRPAKTGGAFCASILPGVTPYVLINYVGQARDVSTIAHELGHAVHSMLASHNSVFTHHSTLPLAETASNFGEMLLHEHWLQEADDKFKVELLAQMLDDTYASVIRQTYFSLFEKEAHALIAKGATVDELSALWMKGLRAQFGSSVDVSDIFKYEWLRIPHIYSTPFYCYAYAFGNLLVFALYQRYKEEGKKFVPSYLKMLSYGGSKAPVDVLSEMGIDVTKEAFWQKGFDYISVLVDELEELVRKNKKR